MRTGAIVSGIFHAIIVLLTIVQLDRWFGSYEPIHQEPIPVELMTISDATNIRESIKEEEKKPDLPQPTPRPESQEASLPPEHIEPTTEVAPPSVDKIPEPPPEPAEEEKKEPPKEVKTPTPKPPAPKKEAKKKDADVDQIMKDLLAQGPEQKSDEQPAASDKTRKRVGLGTGLTMSELDALRGQISRCWSPPIGAPNAGQLVVVLEFSLTPDGSVRGTPEVVDSSRMADPYYRAAAEAAQRAIVQCAPYQLPAEKYDIWKDVELTMDPSKIAGL